MAGKVSRLETQHAVEQFLYRQAEILDGRDWDAWMALFTEDGRYWMPACEEQTTGDGQPSIFYEDRNIMEIRLRRVSDDRAWSQQPANRTSHVVSNVIIESVDAVSGELVVRSKFYVAEYRMDEMRYFAGRYRHDLTALGRGYRIRLQRVDLVNAEGPFDYVLQTWL